MLSRYFKREENASIMHVDAEGREWFLTGDVAVMDEDGYMKVRGCVVGGGGDDDKMGSGPYAAALDGGRLTLSIHQCTPWQITDRSKGVCVSVCLCVWVWVVRWVAGNRSMRIAPTHSLCVCVHNESCNRQM